MFIQALRIEGIERFVDPRMIEQEIADATNVTISDLDRAADEMLRSSIYDRSSCSQPSSLSERRRATRLSQLYNKGKFSPLISKDDDDDDNLSIGSDDVIYLTTI